MKINFSLPDELVQKIKDHKGKTKLSQSAIVEIALEEYFERIERKM